MCLLFIWVREEDEHLRNVSGNVEDLPMRVHLLVAEGPKAPGIKLGFQGPISKDQFSVNKFNGSWFEKSC